MWGTFAGMKPLTARQSEVLDLFLSGLTYKEVAAACGISPSTINPHLKVCARKMGTTKISREALAERLAACGA